MVKMKKQTVRVAIAQINCTVGDLEGNSAKILQAIKRLEGFGVELVVFPELSLTGYPPEDLLLKPKFIEDNLSRIKELAASIGDVTAVIGFVDKDPCGIFNAAAVIHNKKIRGVYHKTNLPNYGVFDERRYFAEGKKSLVFGLGKIIAGVNICEDIWHKQGPTQKAVRSGAKLIVNINASPYYSGKIKDREAVILKQARENHCFICHANLVGGQDELVFDGRSMIVSDAGKVICRAEAFKEDLILADLAVAEGKPSQRKNIFVIEKKQEEERLPLPRKEVLPLDPRAEIYQALTLGLGDYVSKNGFQKVVLGLSGGIDSSLVASLAADALGRENVVGVFMPTRYSSLESEADAKQLAQNLGIKYIQIPVEQIYKMNLVVLEPHFLGSQRDTAEENLQARIRGNILMALSNKFGWLVLATGNKSEMSTGYATLYGDMAGGFAVIKDVPKTLVYELARYRNSLGLVIPERVFTKAPTAELKPDQKDVDTLPPYELLDPILKAYVEEDKSLAKIEQAGFEEEAVRKAINLVDKSEYKRRQAPPGIKITPRALGRDRRMPITNKYKGT